jgi:exodeoxyribonuclease-3
MKITTWNVNGLRAREGQLTEWVMREKPDVLCLQEIKASLAQVPERIGELDGYHTYWHGGEGGYSGVALHVRKGFAEKRPVFSHPAFDHEWRIVTAALGDLDIASIYVPNGGKDLAAKLRFLQAMDTWVGEAHARGRKLVLCGDLNVALEKRDVHAKLQNPQQIGQTADERGLLAKVLAHGLHDLLREKDPSNDDLFTWWAPWRQHKERNIGWRLDYVLASDAIAGQATSCRVERLFGSSDHGPVTAVFEGALFDPAAIVEGPAQERLKKEDAPQKAPQLDLFGGG